MPRMRRSRKIRIHLRKAILLVFTANLPLIAPMPTAFEVAEMPMSQAVQVIRSGLPARAFVGVANVLDLSVDELAKKLGVPPRTIRHQRKKATRLSSANTEKIVRTARVLHLAKKIFSTNGAISGWLNSPAPALDGARPIDLLDTGLGAREVEAVLNGIAYGNVI